MLDLISMWKNPKMIGFTILTALLYAALIFPFQQFTIFGGHADFGRLGIGVPVAFSFLFGPAAAWGAAFGNVIRDVATSRLDYASFFGFFGNLIVGYVPYKLWSAITSEKPDLKSIKKIGLFIGISLLVCGVCGAVIGWGLFWLGYTPFMPTAFLIALADAVWAIVLGSILLALTYSAVSKRKMLYTDILNLPQPTTSLNKTRSIAILTVSITIIGCFALSVIFNVDALLLLPFVAASVIATAVASK
jgi:energy-coupling factor transport system substrate-specific component